MTLLLLRRMGRFPLPASRFPHIQYVGHKKYFAAHKRVCCTHLLKILPVAAPRETVSVGLDNQHGEPFRVDLGI